MTRRILAFGPLIGWMIACGSLEPPPERTSSAGGSISTPAPTQADSLELLSSRGSFEYGYHTVEGEVLNTSNRSLENVAIVVTWYTNDGQIVKSDDALIDFNPILAGQRSPFKSITSSNPAMARYTVQFKHLFGGTIPMKDSRPQ